MTRLTYLAIAALSLGAAAPAPAAAGDAARTGARSDDPADALAVVARKRSSYRDGRYRATGWYGSLPSSIGVSLTLRSNRICRVEVTPHATDPTSRDLQERFARAVGPRVVGKRIDEVKLTRLAGSSGTTLGFNDALRRIRAKARIER
jgi:uncharacterized protein with FMN-binding domain